MVLNPSSPTPSLTHPPCAPGRQVSVLDALFLGRELPSRKSCLSLVATVLGALAYVATDAEFKVNGFQVGARRGDHMKKRAILRKIYRSDKFRIAYVY